MHQQPPAQRASFVCWIVFFITTGPVIYGASGDQAAAVLPGSRVLLAESVAGPAAALPSPAAALPSTGPNESAAAAAASTALPSSSSPQLETPLQSGFSLPDGAAPAATLDAALNRSATSDPLPSPKQQQAVGSDPSVTGDPAAVVTPSAPSPAAESSSETSPLEQQQPQQQQQQQQQQPELVVSSSQLRLSSYQVLAGELLYVSLDLSSLGGLAGSRPVSFTVVRPNTPADSNNNNSSATLNNHNNVAGTAGSVCRPQATSTSSAGITGTACSFAQPGSYSVKVAVEGAQPLLSGTVTVLPAPAAPTTAPSPALEASPELSSSSSSSAPPELPQAPAAPALPAAPAPAASPVPPAPPTTLEAVWPSAGEATQHAQWNYPLASTAPISAPSSPPSFSTTTDPATVTVSSASAGNTQQLLPIKEVTCFYDPKRGLVTGLRYSRPTEAGQLVTRRVGKTTSRLTSAVSLRDSQHIIAVNVTFTSRAVLALKFSLNTGDTQSCDVTRAVYDAPPQLRGAKVSQAASSVSAVQARMAAMLAAGVYDAGYPMYQKGAEYPAAEPILSQYSYGPTVMGKPTGLASFVAAPDPRNRYIRWLPADMHEQRRRQLAKLKLHWTAVDDHMLAVSAAATSTRECSWWPCKDCHGYWASRNCCCWSLQPGQQGSGGGPNGRPTPGPSGPHKPRRSPRLPWPPWWRPSPTPNPGKSPKPPSPPPKSPKPPGPTPSPKPPRPSPAPPRSPSPPRPSPRPPRPPPSPGADNTTGVNRTSPSPKPRSPSPKPGGRSPSPKPPRPSPRPQSPDNYDYSPEPNLPANFTMSFASRGQHSCVQPVSPLFRVRAFQYAMTKLAASGFGKDYTILMGACSCKVDNNQLGMPIYSCEAAVNTTNPEVGSPDVVAGYVALDIDTSGPFACIDESQPWCQQPDEYATHACATFPAQPGYICVIEPPPDPLPMPMVFVDEGKKCNASVQLSADQQASLRDYMFKFTAGLGLVLTYANFTCQEGGGNAYYQATLILAAGVDVDIYTGSDNIVSGINAKPNLCQTATKPSFCNAAPFSTALTCAVNEYDPTSVYRCPNAAASAQVSFGLAVPACNCTALPDSATYQRNVVVWVTDMMVQAALTVSISVPEGKCIQQNATTCQYEYRVRAQPLDEFADSFAAIETIATDVTNNPQPCWPADSGAGWPFCTYWLRVTACAVSPWDPTKDLMCNILFTDNGG